MAQGADEDTALETLRAALEQGLEDEAEAGHGALAPSTGVKLSLEAKAIPGIAAAPGVAIGPLCFYRREKIIVEATAKDTSVEETRLRQAIQAARVKLIELHDEVKERSGAGKAAIFKATRNFWTTLR